jgi:DNA polymerase elongation subunit (family B)
MSNDTTSSDNKVPTTLSLYVSQCDFKSAYPCIMRTANISRDTFTGVVYSIEGRDRSSIIDYYSNLIHLRENAVYLCSEYHNFPDYLEMDDVVSQYLSTQ